MKHHPPNDFVATPQRGRGRDTEGEMARRLNQNFQPHQRARAEAQRTDQDPRAMAAAFAAEVSHSRSEHLAVARAEAFTTLTANIDVIGALSISTHPAEAGRMVQDSETQLDRIFAERRKIAEKAKDVWRHGLAAFNAWADLTGAKLRSAPWPLLAYYILVVVLAALVEAWVISQVLAGPPIVGVPTPFVLGLIFAGGSLAAGMLAALGHMLAADARDPFRLAGWALLTVALAIWGFLSLTGAHMRAVIEQGGSGTVPEIMASMQHGPFAPMLSPLALLLAAASLATSVAMWVKTTGYFGVPLGHRKRDEERRWAIAQLNVAEEAHKVEIRSTVAAGIADLDQLETAAWRPTNDAIRLEREIVLIITQARESERAIHRSHSTQLTAYGNTFRRVRPGCQIGDLLMLDAEPEEAVGDPKALHVQVEALEHAATEVSVAVAEGKIRLHEAELAHLSRVDALYADTRGGTVRQALSPT